jgi:RHS repeat-associated protein
VAFNLRYPGQYFDKESGLYYNVHRSYKPDVGGYTQNDPIGLNGGWNRRTYVGGNPLKYTDPDGLLAQVIGPAIPVLGIGCALTDGCRKAVSSAIQSCGNAVGSLKDWLLSTSNPLEGEPGSCSTCNNSKGDKKQDRYYGADGWPATDVDYDHNHKGENGEKAGRPHAHDWGRPSDGSRPTHDDRGPARPVQPGEVR